MEKRIYVETTVVSYLTAKPSRDILIAGHQEATRQLWPELLTKYDTYISVGGRYMKDPIVEEVRKHRMEHTQRFQGDLSAICADLRSVQITAKHKVVRLESKKLTAKNGSLRHTKVHG